MARKEKRGKQTRVQRVRDNAQPIGPVETDKPADEELEALKPTKEEIRSMRTVEDD